ncbi:hypothetical protein [Negativibacillus massiliensis]|uniref:hypothetical protein n=1 Tax=Negativibacillus massiliensis TaxID=1871035 RepID=UPI003AF2997F
MERLVTRIGNEPAVPTEFDMDFAFDLDKETFDKLQRIFNRLCDLTDILGDDYDLDRLKEMVEADREGKCVVLPCRVGDKVYCIQSYFNDAKMRSEKKVKCRVVDFMQSLPDLFECEGMIYKFSDIGKIVFLTSEEAEAALERMKRNE